MRSSFWSKIGVLRFAEMPILQCFLKFAGFQIFWQGQKKAFFNNMLVLWLCLVFSLVWGHLTSPNPSFFVCLALFFLRFVLFWFWFWFGFGLEGLGWGVGLKGPTSPNPYLLFAFVFWGGCFFVFLGYSERTRAIFLQGLGSFFYQNTFCKCFLFTLLLFLFFLLLLLLLLIIPLLIVLIIFFFAISFQSLSFSLPLLIFLAFLLPFSIFLYYFVSCFLVFKFLNFTLSKSLPQTSPFSISCYIFLSLFLVFVVCDFLSKLGVATKRYSHCFAFFQVSFSENTILIVVSEKLETAPFD